VPAQPAAKEGDIIQGIDVHTVMVPSPTGPVPTPTPGHPFMGRIDAALSANVKIMGKAAATLGSVATNQPQHVPIGGPSFLIPPTNRGQIMAGSTTVFINGAPAARNGDAAETCDDVLPLPDGKVVATGTVLIG
jgi:uncharacterized Zn-binding protein involved in type VI secretion